MESYSATLQRIYNLRGGVIDLRLDRMNQALGLFDHPEQKFPSIHIAGTNGKGSTAAMLQRMLTLGGYRAALYTSPHLVSFTERIRIGEQEISPQEVVELAAEIRRRLTKANLELTFFEFVTAMAFVNFARRKIDVAVVEVGLGGRLDATNLVRPLVSVITTIAKDHEAYLGAEIKSIAREKAGIIKTGVPVVLGALPDEATQIVDRIAAEHGAETYHLGREFKISLKNGHLLDYKGMNWRLLDLSVALYGRHQRDNAGVALAALEVARGAFPVRPAAVHDALVTVSWPGRFEVMSSRPCVVLDGAHNVQGVEALVEALGSFRGGRKIRLLFASMSDKNWPLMLNMLLRSVDEMVLTRAALERSAAPEELARAGGGRVPHRLFDDSHAALATLLAEAKPDEIVLIAGSLYLLGEIRPLVQDWVRAREAHPAESFSAISN